MRELLDSRVTVELQSVREDAMWQVAHSVVLDEWIVRDILDDPTEIDDMLDEASVAELASLTEEIAEAIRYWASEAMYRAGFEWDDTEPWDEIAYDDGILYTSVRPMVYDDDDDEPYFGSELERLTRD